MYIIYLFIYTTYKIFMKGRRMCDFMKQTKHMMKQY